MSFSGIIPVKPGWLVGMILLPDSFSVLPRPFWCIGPISLTCGRDIGRYAFRMYSASAQLINCYARAAPVARSMQDYSYLLVWLGI